MSGVSRNAVQDTVTHYRGLHVDSDVETRKEQYTTLVNHYYDLVTDFYEFGWGQHFHFAPRLEKEKFLASLERHERFLSGKLGLTPGMKVLDVGCGVGGPARYIAQSTGAAITGLNNNAYQIKRCERHTRRAKLTSLVEFVKADFMELQFRAEQFDAIYTIEASCHAPDRVKLFTGLRRVLKPGALFAGYEWCLTDAYAPDNARHAKIKKDIELGNGLPDLSHMSVIDEALAKSGFELLEAKDLAPTADVQTPWYLALTGEGMSLSSLPRTPAGRGIMNVATGVMEKLRIAPEGTRRVSDFLNEGADALVAGGRSGIFTPMYFFMARNPG
jgi:sterol 24-C-methyltransferase